MEDHNIFLVVLGTTRILIDYGLNINVQGEPVFSVIAAGWFELGKWRM
jgi:hypothetical protein